ncbi:phage tail protein, partial [Ornithobacterium rhinotracheale]
MKYKIYRNNDVIATVRANGNLTEKIFSEETLTMDFSLNRFILFKVGDRVSVYGKNYYIVEEPSVEKISTRQYRYNLTFNGVKYRLSEVKYFFYDHENRLSVPEFSITGTATKMLELVVANTNRAGQLGWRIGKVSTTETKTIDFSNSNCLAALARIAEEFDIELWIDADKSIHLENRTQSSGYRLEYGKSKGIKSISRNPYTEASLVTRLYAQGGTKNLPANYRNGQKRLRMPVPYLEKNTAFYGVVEHVQNFDEIYPKRVGVVTKIFDNEPRMFADETLDFDLNEHNQYGSKYLIAGTSAKVIFQTGDLAGYVLEVQKGGFNSQTKAFTLLKNKEEKAFEIPSAQFKPRVGDKYILVDIMMPEAYVLEAERELQAAAQKYLDKNSKQRFVYGIVPDPLYLKKINFSLKLGNTIRFKDEDFGLDADIRVVSITRDINNPYLTAFEIAEQPTITQLVRNYIEKERRDNIIIAEQRKNEQRISEAYETMQEIQNNTFDA